MIRPTIVPSRSLDEALHSRLTLLARGEREATVGVVGHLAELAATMKPRPPRGTQTGSRHIPAHVRRTVWQRDDGRCAFNGKGGRCSQRRFLEWHHVRPFGHQGPATVENIALRCRAHTVYESEQVFGRFDPPIIREAPELYGVSREFAPFRNGGADSHR